MVRSSLRILCIALFLTAPSLRTASAQAPRTDAEQADELLAKAIELHKAQDLVGAVETYRIALELAPERADIRSNLGAALVGLGRFPEGIEQYKKALAIRPDPVIRLNLGLALYKAGRGEEAIPELQAVVDADPANTQAPLILADCLLGSGRYQQVVDLLSPRERIYPSDLSFAYLLGMALLRTGDNQRGQVLIDRIFSKGDSAEGHLLMGLALLNRENYPAALPELERAVAINPDLPTLQVAHGRALLGTSQREKAQRVFRAAVERSPDDFEANLYLGTIYRLDQKFDLALTYLKRAARVRPDSSGVKHAMAATYLGLGDAAKARELLENVIAGAPDFIDAHVLLATTYYRLRMKAEGDRERATVARLTAEQQANQPGAKKAREVDEAQGVPPVPNPGTLPQE